MCPPTRRCHDDCRYSEVKEHDGVRPDQAASPSTGARPDRAVAGLLAAACTPAASTAPSEAAPTEAASPSEGAASPSAAASGGADMDALIAAAKAEGALTAHRPAGRLVQLRRGHQGVRRQVRHRRRRSSTRWPAPARRSRPSRPTSTTLAPRTPTSSTSASPSARPNKDLFQPYKVATWDTIPDIGEGRRRLWYGDYYGVLSFETNTEAVANPPKDWADLLKPEYKNQVALDGDPRTSNQAIKAVYASALANGGTLDNAQPGLDFWAKIVKAGNFVPVDANPATIVSGATPITIQWYYNGLPSRDKPTRRSTSPSRPAVRFGGVYVQAISRRAPSQRRQAVDGVPVLRRGPDSLAEGLLQPDPLRRPGHARRGPGGPGGEAARQHRCGLPDAGAAGRRDRRSSPRAGTRRPASTNISTPAPAP